MKLKTEFITHEIDGVQYLVPVGGEAFSGLVRSNAAAAFILDCLREDITEEQIVDKMCRRYDAPREVIAADTAKCLNTLREIHALEESE